MCFIINFSSKIELLQLFANGHFETLVNVPMHRFLGTVQFKYVIHTHNFNIWPIHYVNFLHVRTLIAITV